MAGRRAKGLGCGVLIATWLALLLPMGTPAATSAPPLTPPQRAWLAKAERHEKDGWIYLHIEGGPRERGFQYGYLLAPEIAQGLKGDRLTWEYQTAMPWGWVVKKASAMYAAKVPPEFMTELGGIAEGMRAAGVEVSRDEILTYNAMYELSWYWWPEQRKKLKKAPTTPPLQEGCSAFIATGSMTADHGIVMGHNSMQDYSYPLPDVILDVAPDKGHRILMQTYPGWIHSGTDFFVTDAGLVGTETTLGDYEGYEEGGVPEFVRMRRATQYADSIDQWCAMMKDGNNGGYANAWLLGDVNTGEIARLELGLRYVGFQKKSDGYFTGSNVAVDPKILRFETDERETDIRVSGVARRVRWHQLMAEYAGKIDAKLAERFEADHLDTYLGKEQPDGRTLCAHNDLDADPKFGTPFSPSGSVDAKVLDSAMAKKMSFEARWGAPCGRAFDAGQFLEQHPQYDWMRDILPSRPSQPWALFTAGETK